MADPYNINDRLSTFGVNKSDASNYLPRRARGKVAPDPAPATRDPTDYLSDPAAVPLRGAQAFDAAGFRALAGKPAADPAKPNFSNVVGDATIAGPDFSNVTGDAVTVPNTDNTGIKRRVVAPVDGGPDPQYAMAGHVSENVSGPAEAERQARLGELDNALTRLEYGGGGLNMRSKRELFGSLLGFKKGLTEQAYDATNQRGITNARMATDTAQSNANLSEAAARRRSDANQFNADLGERAYQYDTTRQDNADALDASAPLRALEYAKGLQDLRITGDKYDVTRDQTLDKGAQDWIANYRKANPTATEDQALAARMEVEAQGTGPISPTARVGLQRSTNAIEDQMNAGTPFLDDWGMGVFRAPLSQNETDPARRGTLKPQDISYTPAGGFVGFAQKFLPGEDLYMATPAGMENDPRAPRAYVPQSVAEAQMRAKNALMYRAARRSQQNDE